MANAYNKVPQLPGFRVKPGMTKIHSFSFYSNPQRGLTGPPSLLVSFLPIRAVRASLISMISVVYLS
ncbi:MAG: hypothetical protein DHS20C11_11020 [Lysobacteraceae bacterium]|nr:MAG: hypothetical protein DHS20C11_11020 [Xanthomonadaceae bacterium]